MNADPNLLIAFAAGLLSFLSPCVLPLIPSYLSFIGGVSFGELQSGSADRTKVFRRTLAFVGGFTLVFVVLGILFSSSVFLFSRIGTWINIVAGGIVVLLGLNIVFDFISVLNLEKRMHLRNRPNSYAGAAVVGMAFGAGWSPCIGPILAGILFLAGTNDRIIEGALLLVVYSFGLGLPFLAASLAFSAVSARLNQLKRHFGTIRIISGVFLVLVGLLIAFGRFQLVNGILARWGYSLQAWNEANASSAGVVFGSIVLFFGLLHPAFRLIRRKPVFRPVGSAVSGLLIIVSILQYSGVIDLASLIAGWLSFQGI